MLTPVLCTPRVVMHWCVALGDDGNAVGFEHLIEAGDFRRRIFLLFLDLQPPGIDFDQPRQLGNARPRGCAAGSRYGRGTMIGAMWCSQCELGSGCRAAPPPRHSRAFRSPRRCVAGNRADDPCSRRTIPHKRAATRAPASSAKSTRDRDRRRPTGSAYAPRPPPPRVSLVPAAPHRRISRRSASRSKPLSSIHLLPAVSDRSCKSDPLAAHILTKHQPSLQIVGS